MIGRQIAAFGMEIVVGYRKEGKAGGLDSEVMLYAPQIDKFAFQTGIWCLQCITVLWPSPS